MTWPGLEPGPATAYSGKSHVSARGAAFRVSTVLPCEGVEFVFEFVVSLASLEVGVCGGARACGSADPRRRGVVGQTEGSEEVRV